MMIYDFPLTDWISMSLHRTSLEKLVEKIEHNQDISEGAEVRQNNRRYIEKILREEISKQFSDKKRPMLEVILNSVDARRRDYTSDYEINTYSDMFKFRVRDSGEGMSLRDILKFLIIPFSTAKKGIEEIGRFGVGFLSTFNYCINEPKKARVNVETSTKSESYQVEFYSTSHEVSDMRMRLQKKKLGKEGTGVTIRTAMPPRSDVFEYLFSNLSGIPTYRAHIYLKNPLRKRIKINDDSRNKWYSAPVELDIDGRKIIQPVGIRESSEKRISLTSQGVTVISKPHDEYGLIVAFPPAVQVVEGRDEFKIDDSYKKSVDSAFVAFERYIKDRMNPEGKLKEKDELKNLKKKLFISKTINFFPEVVSAFELKRLGQVPNLQGIMNELLPDKKYVALQWQIDHLFPFLGDMLINKTFAAAPAACQYWQEVYGSYEKMKEELMAPVGVMSPKTFMEKTEKNHLLYPNLNYLAKSVGSNIYGSKVYTPSISLDHIVLINGPKETQIPLLLENYKEKPALWINLNHPYVAGDFNPIKVYATFSHYLPQVYSLVYGSNRSFSAEEDNLHRICAEVCTGQPLSVKIKSNTQKNEPTA